MNNSALETAKTMVVEVLGTLLSSFVYGYLIFLILVAWR